MPTQSPSITGSDSAPSASDSKLHRLSAVMSGIRLASISGLLLLNLRFLILEMASAHQGEIVAFILVGAIILVASLYKPVLGPLLSFPLVIIFGLFHFFQFFFSSQAPLFPFVAATLAWFSVCLLREPVVLCQVTPYGWLADCFGLALFFKIVVSLASPSLVNGLWAAAVLPQDIWMTEFQALNIGFLLANGVLAFQILATEMRNRQEHFKRLLAIEFILVVAITLTQWSLGWPEQRNQAITAPFFGVHELGAFAAAFFGITLGVIMAKESPPWCRLLWIAAFVLSTLVLLISGSKSAWLAAILMVCSCLLYRFKLAGLGVLLGWMIALLLLRIGLDMIPDRDGRITERVRHFLHPENWREQSNNQDRLKLYHKGWALLVERPLDGVGIGDFRISETPSTRKIMGEMSRRDQNIHDAHNFLLNIASEMGVPSTVLFLALLVVSTSVCLSRIGQADFDSWMLASLFANFGFLFPNLFNCVITWPYQALFMGQFLAMPFAATRSGAVDPQVWRKGLGPIEWKFWAPLLPALLIIIAAPFSIAHDRVIQDRSAGNFHWSWQHDGNQYSIMPEVIFRVAPQDNVRAIEIAPLGDRPTQRRAKIRVLMDGREVYYAKLPKSRPLIVPISSTSEHGLTEVRILAPAPWENWRLNAGAQLAEVARIRLIGDQGPINARELAAER